MCQNCFECFVVLENLYSLRTLSGGCFYKRGDTDTKELRKSLAAELDF
jgi:hypothetical protein